MVGSVGPEAEPNGAKWRGGLVGVSIGIDAVDVPPNFMELLFMKVFPEGYHLWADGAGFSFS